MRKRARILSAEPVACACIRSGAARRKTRATVGPLYPRIISINCWQQKRGRGKLVGEGGMALAFLYY